MTADRQNIPILRVARPTNDLATLRSFYCDGAGFGELASFFGHGDFDGLVLGYPNAPWHLELLKESGVVAPRAEGPEHLLVLYMPDKSEWRAAVDRMQTHGYEPVAANNPYWDVVGMTFEDPVGYRLVFQNRAWTA